MNFRKYKCLVTGTKFFNVSVKDLEEMHTLAIVLDIPKYNAERAELCICSAMEERPGLKEYKTFVSCEDVPVPVDGGLKVEFMGRLYPVKRKPSGEIDYIDILGLVED